MKQVIPIDKCSLVPTIILAGTCREVHQVPWLWPLSAHKNVVFFCISCIKTKTGWRISHCMPLKPISETQGLEPWN